VTTHTAAQLKVDAEPGLPFIDTERVFDAPRELVFRCWTEPALLKQWLGPKAYEMRIDEYDVRDGGRYRYTHVAEGGAEYGFHGVFHGEPTMDSFVQTFEFEGAPGNVSIDRLQLVDLGDGRTLARTHSTFETLEARDAMVTSGMADGMREGYERLDAVVASLGAS
jgi:uncharacterized protein YndB with AHSA1/START domain